MDNRASARRNARLATPLRPPALLIRLVAHLRSPPRRASARATRRRRLATRQRRRRPVWHLESRARGRPHPHMSPDGQAHAATITYSTPRPGTTVQFRAYKDRVIASCDTLISSVRVGSARRHCQWRGPPSAAPRPLGGSRTGSRDTPLYRQGPSSTPGSHIALSTSSSTISIRGLSGRHGRVVATCEFRSTGQNAADSARAA